jgi:hypothetical protein
MAQTGRLAFPARGTCQQALSSPPGLILLLDRKHASHKNNNPQRQILIKANSVGGKNYFRYLP